MNNNIYDLNGSLETISATSEELTAKRINESATHFCPEALRQEKGKLLAKIQLR